jgi:hypothetical protein
MEMLPTNETWVFPYCFLAFAVTLGDETETSRHVQPCRQLAKLQFKRRRIVELQHGRVPWRMVGVARMKSPQNPTLGSTSQLKVESHEFILMKHVDMSSWPAQK